MEQKVRSPARDRLKNMILAALFFKGIANCQQPKTSRMENSRALNNSRFPLESWMKLATVNTFQ